MAQGLFQNNQGPRGTAFIPGVRTLAPPAAKQFSAAISHVLMLRSTLQSPQPASMCISSENRLPREPFIRSLLTSRRNNSGMSLPLCPEAPGNVGRSWAEVVRCALLPTPDCMRLLGDSGFCFLVRLSVEPSCCLKGGGVWCMVLRVLVGVLRD